MPETVVSSSPMTVLLVEPSPSESAFFQRVLLTAGFLVSVSDSFHDARAILDVESPRLLMTALRLGAYNGLHLVVRAKARRPDIAAIVTTDWVDTMLQSEAERLGATFAPTPITEIEVLAVTARTCFRDPSDERPIRSPFERRLTNRRLAPLPAAFEPERRVAGERRRNVALGSATAFSSE